MVLGTGAEAGNITTLQGIPIYNDIYNYGINKQLNQLVRPEAAVISGTYLTPKFATDRLGMKVLSYVVRDWQLGTVLRYQNGALIQTPYSNNQLNLQLARATPTAPQRRQLSGRAAHSGRNRSPAGTGRS